MGVAESWKGSGTRSAPTKRSRLLFPRKRNYAAVKSRGEDLWTQSTESTPPHVEKQGGPERQKSKKGGQMPLSTIAKTTINIDSGLRRQTPSFEQTVFTDKDWRTRTETRKGGKNFRRKKDRKKNTHIFPKSRPSARATAEGMGKSQEACSHAGEKDASRQDIPKDSTGGVRRM